MSGKASSAAYSIFWFFAEGDEPCSCCNPILAMENGQWYCESEDRLWTIVDKYTDTWGDSVERDFAEAEKRTTTAQRAQRQAKEEASVAERNLSLESSRMFNHAESQKLLNSVGKGRDRHIEKMDEPCKFLYCDERAPKREWRLNAKGVLCAPLRRHIVVGSECWAHEYTNPKTKIIMKPRTCARLHPNEVGWREEWNTNLFFRDGMPVAPILEAAPPTSQPFQCYNCGSSEHQPKYCDTEQCGHEFLGECSWGKECKRVAHHGKPLKWLGSPDSKFVEQDCVNCGSSDHVTYDCTTETCGNEFFGPCELGRVCKRAAHHGKPLIWLGPADATFRKKYVKKPAAKSGGGRQQQQNSAATSTLKPFVCVNCGSSGHHPKDCTAEMCGNEFLGPCKRGKDCMRAAHHGKPLKWLGSQEAYEKFFTEKKASA